MSTQDYIEVLSEDLPDGNGLQIGIVTSKWNTEITSSLRDAAIETLTKAGVEEDSIKTIQVPGSFELPAGAKMLLQYKKFDAVICLGCVVKGETSHDEYINQSVANSLSQLSILSNIPCIFGLLTTNTEQQALDRSGGKYGNKGAEAAATALQMAALKKSLTKREKTIGY